MHFITTVRIPSYASWANPQLALGALGLALVIANLEAPQTSTSITGAITFTALVLAALPTRLTGEQLPIPLLALALIPAWLLGGVGLATAIALIAHVFARLVRAQARLSFGSQVAATLLGVGLGASGAALVRVILPQGEGGELVGAVFLAVGLWLGQIGLEWLSPFREQARSSWLICGLTNLILLPPGIFIGQMGASEDTLLLAGSLSLTVTLVFLVRTLTNAETRSLELEAKAASASSARDSLELIVDQAPEAIISLDAGGSVRWLNRTAMEWLGEHAESAVGRSVTTVVPVRSGSGKLLDHIALLKQAARGGRPIHEEGWLDGSSAAPEHVLASYSAAGKARAGELGLLLLRDAGAVAESMREQEELAVHLSHELRAPLTTILGYAQMMSRPDKIPLATNSPAEFARRISESGDYMLRLVNNLLDLGQLTRSTQELPRGECDVAALTRQVVEAHLPQAAAKNQKLSMDGPTTPLLMLTSDLALRQILTNLVANAIKYTPPDGWVKVRLNGEGESIRWQVSDNGIGMPPEEQAKLFTRFFRSQRPEARLIKGTGLGLALTRALVDRLGGNITVESEVDKGSTFTVSLPRRAVNEPLAS